MAVSRRDCGEPVRVELRCAHDYRAFEVEETKSAPRSGLTHLLEQQAILDVLHSDRFVDMSPAEVWPRCSMKASTSAPSGPSISAHCSCPAAMGHL